MGDANNKGQRFYGLKHQNNTIMKTKTTTYIVHSIAAAALLLTTQISLG